MAPLAIVNRLQQWKKMGTNQSFPMLFYSRRRPYPKKMTERDFERREIERRKQRKTP
jgi:hypothetical protein